MNTFDLTQPGFWQYLLPSLIFCITGNLVLYFLEYRNKFFGIYNNRIRKNKNRLHLTNATDTTSQTIDADVLAESERLRLENYSDLKKLAQTKPFVLSGIYKKFIARITLKKFVAVQDLSFEVGGKECFGLLGLNGAGKTTTLKV